MSKKLLVIVMGCAVALCLGLVGCGGGSGSGGSNAQAAPTAEEMAGVWDIQNTEDLLAAMGESAEEMTDDMKKMAAELIPQICFLNINADKTFQLVAMSDAIEGTWELDGTQLTLSSNGSPVSATIDGNTLTIDQDGVKMVFAKAGDQARDIPTEEELTAKIMELVLATMAEENGTSAQ